MSLRIISPSVYSIIKPIVSLLKQWDDVNGQNYGYLDTLYPQAGFILGSTRQKGHDEIRRSREESTDPDRGPTITVQHHLEKIWLLAGPKKHGGQPKLVFTGDNDYALKSGKVISAAFTSRVAMRKDSRDIEYKFYDYIEYVNQVELMNAIAEFND